MAPCKFCEKEIVFAWHEKLARWIPCEPESLTGDEQIHESERGVVHQQHLRRHYCDPQARRARARAAFQAAGGAERQTVAFSTVPIGRMLAYSTLFVTPNAPPEVIQAAYRALAKLYHPDFGGDPSRMVELNKAYDELVSKSSAV